MNCGLFIYDLFYILCSLCMASNSNSKDRKKVVSKYLPIESCSTITAANCNWHREMLCKNGKQVEKPKIVEQNKRCRYIEQKWFLRNSFDIFVICLKIEDVKTVIVLYYFRLFFSIPLIVCLFISFLPILLVLQLRNIFNDKPF